MARLSEDEGRVKTLRRITRERYSYGPGLILRDLIREKMHPREMVLQHSTDL